MALFSRRGKSDEPTVDRAADSPATEATTAATTAAPAVEVQPEPVPHVGISVSTFGAGPQAAPAQPKVSASVGMPDNAPLQAALAALPDAPESADIMNVMRQALQGQLYVRAQGNAQAQLADGKPISLAITTYQDKRFLLVFTGGGPLQLGMQDEQPESTTVLGQAAHHIFRTAIDSGYDGVYLDHASEGARLVLPIELIRKALEEGAVPFELKTLLSAQRTAATAAQVAETLTRTKVWVAAGAGPDGRIGLAEVRGESGERRLALYSHPLEVIAVGRGDRPLPLEPAQLGNALASEPALTGAIIDSAGPWIELSRDDLAPVIALAD